MKKILLLSILGVFLLGNIASALSGSDFKTRNGIHYYDKTGTTLGYCGGGSGTLSGENGEQKTWNFLVGKLSKEQAAGIAGNLSVESGFAPDAQEDGKTFNTNGSGFGGWGIAQWTNYLEKPGDRRDKVRDAVKKAGLPYTNENTPASQIDALLLFELNYMYNEADDRGDLDKLRSDTAGKTGTDAVRAAATSWHKWYEISADPNPTNRINRALDIYNRLKDLVGSTSAPSAGCNKAVSEGVVYYSQYDPAWADHAYGSSTIEASGCGPTSLAMIISTLKGSEVTPPQVADFGKSYYVPGSGTSHALFSAAALNWGLKSTAISKTESAVKLALSKGGLVIATGSGAYPYTTAGHVIVIRGVTSDGRYLVSNPLPLLADQGKSSEDVASNSDWYNKGYSWSAVGIPASALYVITK